MRRERICRISSVDLEYPSLSLTRRNWLSLGLASGICEPQLAPL